MKALRFLGIVLASILVLGATAFAAGYATSHHAGTPRPAAQHAVPPEEGTPSAHPSGGPSADPSVDPTEEPTQAPEPEPALQRGDKGEQVRELQSRLFQLDWFPELTTGVFDKATAEAVAGFQAKRGFAANGLVDQRTWTRLVAMTEQPTHDRLYNILRLGPALLSSGDAGDDVRDLQARLKQIDWYVGDVTGTFDAATVEAVRGFQAKREIPVTGKVDQRTLDRLDAMTYAPTRAELLNRENQPGALDPRCLTGRALCIDKSSRTLRWVIDGVVQKTVDVRFGASDTPTREGRFHVYAKSRDHVSELYGSSMPFAMFFSGGQAVHYSSDFAARGYDGASHGCVNVRDHSAVAWLFDQVRVGDAVVVYWS